MNTLDFCIIGAMKAATTTLASLLSAHPDIAMADPKEPGFFSRDERFAKGIGWYRAQFGDTAGKVVGEASTCYSRRVPFPRAAERLAAFAPGAKLVYVLRHPVDRAIAHYVHEMRIRFRDGKDVVAFEPYCEIDPAVLSASEYEREIEHLERWFPCEQVRLIDFDDLIADQAGVLAGVQQWLGVSTVAVDPVWENRAREQVRRNEVEGRIRGLRSSALVRTAKAVVPRGLRRMGIEWMRSHLSRSESIERRVSRFEASLDKPTGERRRALVERFNGTVDAIEALMHRELGAWRA